MPDVKTTPEQCCINVTKLAVFFVSRLLAILLATSASARRLLWNSETDGFSASKSFSFMLVKSNDLPWAEMTNSCSQRHWTFYTCLLSLIVSIIVTYSSENNVCGVTLSLLHTKQNENSLARVGIEPITFGILAQYYANWATWSG